MYTFKIFIILILKSEIWCFDSYFFFVYRIGNVSLNQPISSQIKVLQAS